MWPLQLFFAKKRYFAVGFSFATLSLLYSTWIIHIPMVAERLGMSESEIGLALFAVAVGSFSIMPLSARILDRWGEGATTLAMILALAFFTVLPFAAPSFSWLCAALFLVGVSSGLLDVAINSLVSVVERQEKVYIMTGSHGFFSLGGMIGAGLGGIVAGWLHQPLIQAAGMSVLVVAVTLFLTPSFIHLRHQGVEKKREGGFSFKPILGLVVIGFFLMISEGAVMDWSTVYFKNFIKVETTYIGIGFAGFSLMMAIGRFYGDRFTQHWGSRRMILTGCILGAVGFSLVISGHFLLAVLGFSVVGIGFSGIVPELYRLAANTPGVQPAKGVATIAGSGYVGFLIGPVALGLVAEHWDLQISFAILLGFSLLSFVLARWVV